MKQLLDLRGIPKDGKAAPIQDVNTEGFIPKYDDEYLNIMEAAATKDVNIGESIREATKYLVSILRNPDFKKWCVDFHGSKKPQNWNHNSASC